MGTIQVTPGEPGRLIVRFPYSAERVAAIRGVPGRRWHLEGKYWTVPHTPEALERMRSLFTSDRVVVAAAVEAALKCRYKPARQRSVEVEVWVPILITFTLN